MLLWALLQALHCGFLLCHDLHETVAVVRLHTLPPCGSGTLLREPIASSVLHYHRTPTKTLAARWNHVQKYHASLLTKVG